MTHGIYPSELVGSAGFFFAKGSFGVIDSGVSYTKSVEGRVTRYCYSDQMISLIAEFTCEDNGVFIRRDYLENHSRADLEINCLLSRFCLDGNSYEVYTQYNGWQHESSGGWQRLVTQVSAVDQGIRTCDGAAPIMALHNLHSGKNTVFHLLPNAQWQMTARKYPKNQKEIVLVETGIYSNGLKLCATPGERIELPTIIYYQADNRIDLDAYKLHEVYNRLYPRKQLPILYNSWLYCYWDLDIDALLLQAETAKELGFEAFMIDAGWFGTGADWSESIGDWTENMISGPCGRLRELSEYVRKSGMIFGLWFEPERALPESVAVAQHPEFFIDNRFLDFSNPKAREYILNVLSEQIDKYEIGWLKFDFNATIPVDPSGCSFYRYLQGQKDFILALREKYPHLYITNCASGGYRMELMQGTMFDSFWLSDNQGPYEGIRIVKDTLKRMPTALIERWNVQKYCDGFIRHGYKEPVGIMFSCNNATWDFILNVDDSFTKCFLAGGPLGFSCDLTAFPAHYKTMWKDILAQYRSEREFYRTATARILVDCGDIIAIEYADSGLTRCVIQVFTKTTYASNLIIYPVVDESVRYELKGQYIDGRTLSNEGIFLDGLEDNHCYVVKLTKE